MKQPAIGILGGTFDPIHNGHIEIARLAYESLELDQVRFIPCKISPHKTDLKPTSPEHRLKMLKLATHPFAWAVVDEIELIRPGPSFSHQTATKLAADFPNHRVIWILGTDQWRALHRWAEPDTLAKTLEFAVVFRGEAPIRRDPAWKMTQVDGSHPAAASLIRKAIASGKLPPPWLNPAVQRYIEDNRLYVE